MSAAATVTIDELRAKLREAAPPRPRRKGTAVRFYLYRPETLECVDDTLGQPVAWEADGNLSALVWLSVRLLGGSKKPEVYALPVLEPVPGWTYCRRALVLRAGGPTAVLSPVRIHALRKSLAFAIALNPSDAPSAATLETEAFHERVARQSREVAQALKDATFARVE